MNSVHVHVQCCSSAMRAHKKVESTAHSKSLHQSLVVSCPKAKWPRKYISPPTEIDPYFTLSRIQGYTSHFSENKAIAIYITACFGHIVKLFTTMHLKPTYKWTT